MESDLCNSYGWDTAIIYIQAMGHSNYVNANCDTTGVLKTDETGDEVCKIFDMAANYREWTTEYSTYVSSITAYPDIGIGGDYGYSYSHTSCRGYDDATISFSNGSFRVSLYV